MSNCDAINRWIENGAMTWMMSLGYDPFHRHQRDNNGFAVSHHRMVYVHTLSSIVPPQLLIPFARR